MVGTVMNMCGLPDECGLEHVTTDGQSAAVENLLPIYINSNAPFAHPYCLAAFILLEN